MVSQYHPDYLLVELGFNDMGWFITDTQETLENTVTFINNARSANPNIKMAIANVPQRSFIGGRADLITKTDNYNATLPGLLNSMYTDESPIYMVQFRENYDCMHHHFFGLLLL
jgi:lysophospholipase L1-like esterase